MGFLVLQSTSPQFSFIIKKNPASGIKIIKLRKGLAFGWFAPSGFHGSPENTQSYCLYFKDSSDGEESYTTADTSNYLNRSQYLSPVMYWDLLDEFFKGIKDQPETNNTEVLKDNQRSDSTNKSVHEHSIFINLVEGGNPKILEHLSHPKFSLIFGVNKENLQLTGTWRKHGSLGVRSKSSLVELIDYVKLVLLFMTVTSSHERSTEFPIDRLTKYAALIAKLDLSFYCRYLFARNLLKSKKNFETVRKELEKSNRYSIKLVYGDTACQRLQFVNSTLDLKYDVVDIGCGSGYYLQMVPNLKERSYYATDIDLEELKIIREKIEKKNLENAFVYDTFEDLCLNVNADRDPGDKVDVLLMEVIEHMELIEAEKLLDQIVSSLPINKLIVSTPNAEFNVYYQSPTDHGVNQTKKYLRHEDHKWEMTGKEFSDWTQKTISKLTKTPVKVTIVPIGHQVNGIPSTQGAIFEF